MNDLRIQELTNLNIDYHAGSTREVLYRCTLLGPYIKNILKNFPEYKLNDVFESLTDWFNLCEANNLEVIESLIELYNFDTINNTPVSFYECYPDIFEKMVDFLLGKINWQPDEEAKKVAVDYSNNLTAQLLNHIYLNK